MKVLYVLLDSFVGCSFAEMRKNDLIKVQRCSLGRSIRRVGGVTVIDSLYWSIFVYCSLTWSDTKQTGWREFKCSCNSRSDNNLNYPVCIKGER